MATTTYEPFFSEEDTDAVLEYMHERSLSCPGCGLPRDETMAFEAQDAYYAEPVRCHACAARDREADDFMRDARDGHADSAGITWAVERYEDRPVHSPTLRREETD